LTVTTTVGRNGRFDSSAQGEEYRLSTSLPLTEQAIPAGLFPGLLGIVSIAPIKHAINFSVSNTGLQTNSVMEDGCFLVEDGEEQLDVISVDVVGHFQAVPTCYLSTSATGISSHSGDVFFEVKGAALNVGTKKPQNDFRKYSLPDIALSTTSRTVYLHNPSSKPLSYRTEALSCRHPGLRLCLMNTLDEVCYDTITCQLYPSQGVIAEGSFAEITVSLIPGAVVDSVNTCSQLYEDAVSSCPFNDSRYVFIVPVSIIDVVYKTSHPPLTLHAVVVLKDSSLSLQSLSAIHTQPVSSGNRNKQHLSHTLVRESSPNDPQVIVADGDLEFELKLPSASVIRRVISRDITGNSNNNNNHSTDNVDDEVLTIRLRGATPIEGSSHYSVNLGEQSQKEEALEWMLTLENCSTSVDLPFRLKCRGVSSPWLQLGQSGGVIPAGDSVSVMLYVVRAVGGSYNGWVEVVNMVDPSNYHAINVTMDVMEDRS